MGVKTLHFVFYICVYGPANAQMGMHKCAQLLTLGCLFMICVIFVSIAINTLAVVKMPLCNLADTFHNFNCSWLLIINSSLWDHSRFNKGIETPTQLMLTATACNRRRFYEFSCICFFTVYIYINLTVRLSDFLSHNDVATRRHSILQTVFEVINTHTMLTFIAVFNPKKTVEQAIGFQLILIATPRLWRHWSITKHKNALMKAFVFIFDKLRMYINIDIAFNT